MSACVPAICNQCGTIFSSGLGVGLETTVIACRAGPCPNCGGTGSMIDGVYSAVEGALGTVIRAAVSENSMKWLWRFATEASNKNVSIAEFADEIEKQDSAFEQLSQFLRDNNPPNWVQFLFLFVAILALLPSYCSESNQLSDDAFQHMFNKAVEAQVEKAKPESKMHEIQKKAPEIKKKATVKKSKKPNRTPRKKNRKKLSKQQFKKTRNN